jgi:transposase
MFVFCDESGLDKRDGARRTGWAPKGYTPRVESLLKRGARCHILPAITIDGLLAVTVYKGHTTKEFFLQWLLDEVLPKMNPYPGPRSILVMDNASWHHDGRILAAIRQRGVQEKYLPPYSPDFNPIEAYFGDLKRYLRRQYKHTMSDYDSDEDFAHFAFCCPLIGMRF